MVCRLGGPEDESLEGAALFVVSREHAGSLWGPVDNIVASFSVAIESLLSTYSRAGGDSGVSSIGSRAFSDTVATMLGFSVMLTKASMIVVGFVSVAWSPVNCWITGNSSEGSQGGVGG